MFPEPMKFYYFTLSPYKRNVYTILYEGLKKRSAKIEVPVSVSIVSPDMLHTILQCVSRDTMSFFYVDVSTMTYELMPWGYRYTPKYIYSIKDTLKYAREITRFIFDFMAKYLSADMSEYKREKLIHDFIVKNTKYDYASAKDPNSIESQSAYNIVGVFTKRKAVCLGIACAFKLMCDYCKVKCLIITGDAGDAGDTEKHAWNIVKLEGKSYHVDATWDIKKKGDISFCYDYLNLDDSLIGSNHSWDKKVYPVCNSVKLNYYYLNKLYVKDYSEIKTFLLDFLSKGKRYIAFKFANYNPDKGIIKQAIDDAANAFHSITSYRYLITSGMNNIYVEFLE